MRTSVPRKAKHKIIATIRVIAIFTIVQRRSSRCSRKGLEVSLSGSSRNLKISRSAILPGLQLDDSFRDQTCPRAESVSVANGVEIAQLIDLAGRYFPNRFANGNAFLPNEDEVSFRRHRCDYHRGFAPHDRPGMRLGPVRCADALGHDRQMIIGEMSFAGNRCPIIRRLHCGHKNVAGRKANYSGSSNSRQRAIWREMFSGEGEPVALRRCSALRTSKTSRTSSPNAFEAARNSSFESALSRLPLAASFPTIVCASRKGTPLPTRYSARSVASNCGSFANDSIRSRLMASSGNIALKSSSAFRTVSTESKSTSLSSCRSRL